MNGLPYYKAYPRDFIEGTIGMPFEIKCAYRVIIDLIYMQGGKLPDDPRYISGLLGCSLRKWSSLRDALIAAGKLQVSAGFLSNYRADKEIETLAKLQDIQRENRSRPNKNKGLQSPPCDQPEPEPEPYKKEEDTNVSSVVSLPDRSSECLAHFNAIARRVGWPEVQKFTPPRRAALSQRIADVGGVDAWMDAITRASSSPLLTGQNNRAWRADFDWLSKAANFTKLMEGNYDPRTSNAKPAHVSQHRADPALEQALRLAGLGPTPRDVGYGN